jgi:hypothetical protein
VGGSFVTLYVSDGNGGFFWLSSTSMRQNQRIDTVLASRSDVNIRCDNASSDARSILEDDQGGGRMAVCRIVVNVGCEH